MKEKIKKFLSDKYNLTLSIFQSLAVLCLIFIELSIVFNILFLFFESVFFILWGIKILIDASKIKYREEVYSKLHYTKEQLEYLKKKDIGDKRNGKFKGVLITILGILLFYMTLVVIL